MLDKIRLLWVQLKGFLFAKKIEKSIEDKLLNAVLARKSKEANVKKKVNRYIRKQYGGLSLFFRRKRKNNHHIINEIQDKFGEDLLALGLEINQDLTWNR